MVLVPLISLYIIWQKKDRLKLVKISSTNWGALILVISMAENLWGQACNNYNLGRDKRKDLLNKKTKD